MSLLIYRAKPVVDAGSLGGLRIERGTMGQIIEQYFEESGDQRYSVTLKDINDWYEERGWIWVQE